MKLMNRTRSSKLIWLLPLLWTAVIFLASFQSGEDSGALSGNISIAILKFISSLGIRFSFETFHLLMRKAAHFCEYAVLGVLVSIARRKAPLWNHGAFDICLWMIVPLIDESIQHFVPGRYGALSDSGIDLCGFLCAVLLYHLIAKRK